MPDNFDITLAKESPVSMLVDTPSIAPGPDLTFTMWTAADKATVAFTVTSTTVVGSQLQLIIGNAEPAAALGDYPYEITSGGTLLRLGTCHVVAYSQIVNPQIP